MAPEHQARYFHAKSESEKDGADPDVFRRQKNQHPAQDEQGYGNGAFNPRVLDHDDKEIL